MKPKSLILIAVAVVCGLVAAFLTARLTAGQSKPPVEMVEIPHAARSIPMGTKITPKDVEQFFVMKKFPRENLPPNAVMTLEEIADKRTMRPIKEGQLVDQSDVNAKGFIDPPAGMMLMSTPISLDSAASGFAIPGTYVSVMATKKSQKKNMDIVFPLFLKVLVLAVDSNTSAPQVAGTAPPSGGGASSGSGSPPAGPNTSKGGGEAAVFQQVSMISFAVNADDSILLTMAAGGGANLRLGMPSQDEDKMQATIDGYTKHTLNYKEKCNIFADIWPEDEKKEEVAKAKVKVPTEAIPAGTRLTDEVLEGKFKVIEFPKDLLPAEAATADKDLADKYATTDLAPGLFVPKPHLAKQQPKAPEPKVVEVIKEVKVYEEMKLPAKAAPDLSVASPKVQADTKGADPKPKVYEYVTITTPQGKRIQKYEVTPKGSVYVGDEPADAPQEPKSDKRID